MRNKRVSNNLVETFSNFFQPFNAQPVVHFLELLSRDFTNCLPRLVNGRLVTLETDDIFICTFFKLFLVVESFFWFLQKVLEFAFNVVLTLLVVGVNYFIW